jgi:hypothetical protein
MKPSLISWNVRGLNEVGKRLKVRNLLRLWKGRHYMSAGNKAGDYF